LLQVERLSLTLMARTLGLLITVIPHMMPFSMLHTSNLHPPYFTAN